MTTMIANKPDLPLKLEARTNKKRLRLPERPILSIIYTRHLQDRAIFLAQPSYPASAERLT